jgi:outer membrane receptor for ferric coprogen and ferric-rhodotorulic acid
MALPRLRDQRSRFFSAAGRWNTTAGSRPGAVSHAARCLCLGWAVAATNVAWAQQPSATESNAASARATHDIPAGPLGPALSRFAVGAGITLAFDPATTQGHSTAGLQGSHTLTQGFALLLKGSGLEAVPRAGGGYTLRQAPAATTADNTGVASPPDATTLTEVRVTADAERSATTEGSPSYTTPSTSTATRLDLSLRETPQSATVITRQRMDDQGMTSITDVVQATPGLFLTGVDGAGRPSFKARGFGANVMYEGFTSAMSSYVPSTQANLGLYDRVEIVRGATGLTQGAGNPSAAINLIHKRPTREFQGSISGSVGRWDDYGATLDVGGPVNEAGTLRARFVASRQDSKTFRDVEALDHDLFYAVAEADLGQRTTLTVGAHRQQDNSNHWWYDLPMSATGGHMNLPRSTFSGNDWEHADSRVDTVFSVLEHRFDNDWKLRFATLHSWRDLDLLGTATYRETTEGSSFYHTIWGGLYDYKHSNYDVSASGPFELLGRKHQLVVGATSQKLDTVTDNRSWSPARISGIDITNHDPYATPEPVGTITSRSRVITRQDSLYLASHLALTDSLKLLVGARTDWYDYENRTGTGSYKVTRNLTRYAGAVYDLDKQHSLYASYTDIFSPQSSKDIGGNILKPIVGENYEVGVKGEYFGGALNASAALFQVDQKNRASLLDDQGICPTFPETSCYRASGLVRTRGIDLELQGALTPQWQIGIGYTYADARYVRDATASNVGKRFTALDPQNLLKLSTLYRFAGDLNRWRVGGSLYWQSRYYAEGALVSGQRWKNEQGAYAVADLIVGYRPSRNLDFQLNVTNLFDKVYYRSIGQNVSWGSTEIYGEPRKLKLTAKYTF